MPPTRNGRNSHASPAMTPSASTSSTPAPEAASAALSAAPSTTGGYNPADIYSYADIPRPFKRWEWTQKAATRKPKALKAVLAAEKQKAQAAAQANAQGGMPETDCMAHWAIDAPPSIRPPKKYCDITGLHANYTDPKSSLRYHNAEVYETIKALGAGTEQAYLGIRGKSTMLM